MSISFVLINVGQKLMSLLDWTEYINFCNAALIACNKQLKMALIQFVQNAFLSKEFVKITRIFSQIGGQTVELVSSMP